MQYIMSGKRGNNMKSICTAGAHVYCEFSFELPLLVCTYNNKFHQILTLVGLG